jgi:hypothetical protein
VELSVSQIIWIVSGSVLVIGWLVVSFTPPSRNRTIIEWLSVTAMYAAILAIFVSLALRAHASGHVFAAWAIGLLCVLFGGRVARERVEDRGGTWRRQEDPAQRHQLSRPPTTIGFAPSQYRSVSKSVFS